MKKLWEFLARPQNFALLLALGAALAFFWTNIFEKHVLSPTRGAPTAKKAGAPAPPLIPTPQPASTNVTAVGDDSVAVKASENARVTIGGRGEKD